MWITPSLAKRIVKRATKGKSMANFQSASYYLEDLARCLHRQCKSYEDAVKSVKKTGKKIHCAYVRIPSWVDEEISKIISKIGKGGIKKQKNGQVFLSRETEMSSSPGVLINEIVIPCDSEMAAYILEYALQWFYGMKRTPRSLTPSTYKAIQTKVPQRFTDWIKPHIDENYQQGGSEWFGRYITKDEIKEVIQEITQSVGLGRQNYRGLAFDYQLEAEKIMLDYALAVTDPVLAIKDCKDFWLLMKPRAFKNCTIALGIARIVERMFELGRLQSQTVDILFSGLWPSAFEGMKKDLDDHTFSETINIDYVDTRDSDWQEQRTQKINEGYNVIFLFASMQSIDETISKEIQNNIDLQEEDGVEAEELDSNKLNALLGLNIKFAILDECDHGLRTPNSTKVLNKFNFLIRFQMSGSDLRALSTEIRDSDETFPQNYFARTIIDETKDVLDPKHPLERPLIRWWGFEEGRLPFENLLPEEMDEVGISRRLRSMFNTHTNEKAAKAKTHDEKKRIMKYRLDKKDELRYDGDGEVVTGVNPREFKRLIQRLEQATDNTDAQFLNHQHIFMTAPTKAGGMAFYNYLKINHPDLDRKVATGWDFKNELEVRQFMGITDKNKKGSHKTLIIVVAKMLRGSNPPWSLVIRCDDYKDFKIGHQIDLRPQNAYGPDGKHSDVLDLNPFRVMRNAPQIAKLNSKKGQTNKVLDSKTLTRFLPYMIGIVTTKQITIEKAEEIHNTFESITYGFNKDTLFDEEGLKKNKEQLTGISETIPDYAPNDPKQGKTFKKKEPKDKKTPREREKDSESEEMKKLLAKAKSLANYLPLLQYLNKTPHDNINELVRKTPPKIMIPWLNYCGMGHNQTDLDLLIEIFDLEQINIQLRFTSKKIKRGLTINEITKISRPKAGDVPMPLALAYEIVGKIPTEVWHRSNLKILDWSCGKGELLLAIKDKLIEFGISKEKIQDILEYGDVNQLNVDITNKVLGFNKGFCYTLNRNDSKDKNVFKFLEEKLKRMKFDIVLTNPPYQWASDDDSGRDTKNNRENLWTRGVTMSFERLSKDDGYVAMVTPPSWRTASYDYGTTSILNDYFRPNNVIVINLDECKRHFKVGSDFSYWVVEKGVKGKKTELVTLAGKTIIDLNSNTFDYGLPRDYESDVIDLVGNFFNKDRKKINLHRQYHGAIDPTWLRTEDKEDKEASDEEIILKYKLDKKDITRIQKSKKGKNIFFKGKYKQYHTLATQKYTYCDKTSKEDGSSLYNKPKVMLSLSGTYEWVADASGEIVIGNYVLSRLLEQGEKIEYIMQVLNSSVYQFMCYQFKSSGFINGKFLSKLPELDFTRSWTEDQIRDEFKVSDRIKKILDEEYDN